MDQSMERLRSLARSWTSNMVLAPAETEASRAALRAMESTEQLLPGIPDDVSLNLIVTRLPWRVLPLLSSISRAWLYAAKSGNIYDARVSSHSTESLVALLSRTQAVIYSMTYNYLLHLPPLPLGGTNHLWQCVSLDGKLYIYGERISTLKSLTTVIDVYVLDLTGRGRSQWKPYAIMQERRYGFLKGQEFGYGARDGKLYVFRPKFSQADPFRCIPFTPKFTSHVYDFKSHAWSPRKRMLSARYDYLVAPLGEEFLVHNAIGEARVESLEVYNPLKDEWRVVGHIDYPAGRPGVVKKLLFTAQGKIYAMHGLSAISVHDPQDNSWAQLYPCRYLGGGDKYLAPTVAVAVDDELIATVQDRSTGFAYLVRSRGFGSENFCILWEDVELPVSFFMKNPSPNNYLMAPVQL